VHMGARVSKGQLLAELDPTDYRLNLEARKAEYDLARLGAERARALYEKKLISEDQYDTAQTLLATRRAQLEQAREQLSFCRLVAPYSGNIAFTYAMPSEVVAAHEPILNLQDVSRLEIRFNLPPRYEPLLAGPDPVRFTVEFDLLPGVSLDADYKEVSLQPDPDTNSYPVTLVVSSPANFTARPGMPATVRLHHPALLPDGWVLPPESLFERAGNSARVWRIDGDMTIHKTSVELDGEGVVRRGLSPGDRIVAAGVNRLREGQKVRIWEREEGL
jgi:RND family efflux transporter MFP subunit